MEKFGSLSQHIRITRQVTTAIKANQVDFNTSVHRHLVEDDAHYHAEKLGLGSSGGHEGWIKAEEAETESHGHVGVETRHKMIAVAAFYLAEKRGFEGSDTLKDWIKAETEIDIMLHARNYKPSFNYSIAATPAAPTN